MRPPARQGRREKKFLCSKRCVRVLTKRRASIIIISTMTKDTGRDKAAEGGYGIFADLHTHTTYSHGKGSVEDNVRAAKFRGLSCLAVTDHGVRHPLVGVKREKFAAMRRDVSAAAEKYGMDVRLGIEANIFGLSGEIDLSASDISQLDVILAGFHASAAPQKLSDAFLFQANLLAGRAGRSSKAQIARNTRAYINCVKRFPVDVITHPGFWLQLDCRELGKACADYGTYVEISSRHRVPDLRGLEDFMKSGVTFVINSDAHRPQDVGRWGYALDLAARAGLDESRIANAGDKKIKLRSER